jgi:hypothetical protein
MAKKRKGKLRSELFHTKCYYFGTTHGNSFWRRYKKKELYERGFGEFWLSKTELNFRLYFTLEPIKISSRNIITLSYGYGHAGKISFKPVLKVHWKTGDLVLVSGFASTKDPKELIQWEKMLRKVMKA